MVVIRRPADGALLVEEDGDEAARYQRPLGGHVEHGERAADTARRELREEVGLELADLRLLGVLENFFVLGGRPGHEIVFVFEASLADEDAYGCDELPRLDDPPGAVWVCWRPPGATQPPLVPRGLAELALRPG